MLSATFSFTCTVVTGKVCGAVFIFDTWDRAASTCGTALFGGTGIESFTCESFGAKISFSTGHSALTIALWSKAEVALTIAICVGFTGVAELRTTWWKVWLTRAGFGITNLARSASFVVCTGDRGAGVLLWFAEARDARICRRFAERAGGATAALVAGLDTTEPFGEAMTKSGATVCIFFAGLAGRGFGGEGLELASLVCVTIRTCAALLVCGAGCGAIAVFEEYGADKDGIRIRSHRSTRGITARAVGVGDARRADVGVDADHT